MNFSRVVLAGLSPLMLSSAALGQAHSSCRAPVAPRGELASWTQQAPLTAATSAEHLPEASLAVGKATKAALSPAASITYFIPPEKPGAQGSYGGLLGVAIEREGTYRVALGGAAWIDVLRNGRVVASVKHGHGPACSGIRKIVDFELEPGNYVVQLSGSAVPEAGVLIAAAQ